MVISKMNLEIGARPQSYDEEAKEQQEKLFVHVSREARKSEHDADTLEDLKIEL